jgi:hypothetical protein
MNLYGGWLIWTNTLLNFLFLISNILLHTGKNNNTRVFLHVIIGFLSYPQCQKVRSYLSASSSNWWMFWQLLVANLFWIMIGLGCGYWRTTKMDHDRIGFFKSKFILDLVLGLITLGQWLPWFALVGYSLRYFAITDIFPFFLYIIAWLCCKILNSLIISKIYAIIRDCSNVIVWG